MNFLQLRDGTTVAVDLQCLLSGAPVALGSPTSVVLTRLKALDHSALSNITLTVQDAPTGVVRWTPTAGQVAIVDLGYLCTVVVTGGSNPGTYPSSEYLYIGVT